MLNKSKLLAGAGAVAVGAVVCSTGVLAADGKGAVYGDVRWSLDAADASGVAGPNYSATNNNSFWGIKGSVTEGQLTAFGGYERTLDNDGSTSTSTVTATDTPGLDTVTITTTFPGLDATRQGYFGLKCDTLGTLQYGQFATAYMESGRKLDPFANTALAGTTGVGGFNSHGQSGLSAETFGAGFINNQVAYTTPSFGGLTVNAALFLDETVTGTTQDQNHDYGVGAEFSNSGLTVGVQALDINNAANFSAVGTASTEVVRAYAGLNVARFGVNVSAEKASLPGADADFIFASGWFGVSDTTRLALALGHENNATGGGAAAEGNSVSLGVFHDVMKNFTGWVAARRFDSKVAGPDPHDDVITMGASYKFNLGFGS